jgi:hypothetical protein
MDGRSRGAGEPLAEARHLFLMPMGDADAPPAADEHAAVRLQVALLEERVAYLQELLASTRDYVREQIDVGLADLRDERAALLQEVRTLNEELRASDR